MNEIVGASVVLALLTAAEGVRRGDADTIVLRRFAFGRWSLAPNAQLGAGLHLLSLCTPLVLPVALSTHAASAGAVGLRRTLTRARARLRRTRMAIALLRINGLAIIALTVALPFAAAASGVWGLAKGLAALMSLCLLQTAFQYDGMRHAGARPRRALKTSVISLWPFSAPSAPARVQALVLDGMPGLAAMHLLLGRDAFLGAVRPLAYDAVRDGADAILFGIVDRETVTSWIAEPPRDSTGDSFCPRCGAAYRASIKSCADCPGVDLVPGASLPLA